MYFDCKINNFYDYGIDLYDNYHMQCFLIPILSIIIALQWGKGFTLRRDSVLLFRHTPQCAYRAGKATIDARFRFV